MKVLFLLGVLGGLCVVTRAQDPLTVLERIDITKVDDLISNPQVVREYLDCFNDPSNRKCDNIQRAMKGVLQEFANTGDFCTGCNTNTKTKLTRIIKRINATHRTGFTEVIENFKQQRRSG